MLKTANAPGLSVTTIIYQGRLADSAGNFSMTFALYNAATAGDLVWGPETHPAVSRPPFGTATFTWR